MSIPIISVIIAAYGQADFINETIKSLTAQTLTDWEAIIIDDGSPDNVALIAQKWAEADNRIHFLHTENHGVSVARNMAAKKAVGKYLMALDGDDLIAPNYLRTCVDALERDPNLKAAFTQMRCFGTRTDKWPVIYDSYARLLINNPLYVSGAVRRTDFMHSGGYDETMKTGFEDWEFWIRFLKGIDPKSIYIHNETMFFYRQKQRSRNTDATADASKFLKCNEQIFNLHADEYHRLFGDIVTPQRMSWLEYWMLKPIAEMHSDITNVSSKDAPAIEAHLKHISRYRILPFRHRCALISEIARAYLDMHPKGLSLSTKTSRRIHMALHHPKRYTRLMLLKERLSPKNWLGVR